MKLSILIPTYMRKDGSTPKYLTRSLDSVFNQTHQDFKIYLIGDKYENEEEVKNILSKYDSEKIFFKNLDVAKERDSYTNKWAIWSYGGVNALNVGIDISLSEGNNYICHLDHDDYWENNHLELINKCIEETNSDWICTKSNYVNNRILPLVNGTGLYINHIPKSQSLIHSSVCMNFKTLPFKYRDLFAENGVVGLPADAELWDRCAKHILTHNLKSTLINSVTCNHIEEGFERN
jgi:glycosyltransferase involved in cell wall biosynthesis